MFNSINLDDKILSSEKFKKDAISFNLIPYLIKNKERYPDIRCYSDGKDCVILNTDVNHPVVVWTSSDFSDYESLSCFLYENFSDNKPLTLTTKNDIYKFFNDKLGILILPFDILISLLEKFSNLSSGDGIIHIPNIEFMNQTLIPQYDYNLKADVTNLMGEYYDLYYMITDVIIYSLLLNLARKKFEEVVGGSHDS
mgnify:CR=1 FL=1